MKILMVVPDGGRARGKKLQKTLASVDPSAEIVGITDSIKDRTLNGWKGTMRRTHPDGY